MKYFAIISIILITFLLAACSDSEGDRIFDEIVGQTSGDETADEPAIELPPDDGTEEQQPLPPVVSDLSGTLTLLTSDWDRHLPVLAGYFMEEHPNVQIHIERMGWVSDISEKVALATRLIADPPDLFNTADMVFEKFSMDALFVELNELIDSPNGIDRSDFFDNILRGAEIGGSLFNVPLVIGTDTVLLNKQYFSSLGIEIDDIRALTLDELLDFYQRAVNIYPEDDIHMDMIFNIMDIFRYERVYDIETGTVNANTPEMRARLELVNTIPTGPGVQFLPDHVEALFSMTAIFGGHIDSSFTHPTINYMYHFATDFMSPWLFLVRDRQDILFSHPVHRTTNCGEIRFRTVIGLSIMRDSPNKELAWEFMRFAMEFPYTLFSPLTRMSYWQADSFPAGRAMFNDHLHTVLEDTYSGLTHLRTIQLSGDEALDAAEREQRINYAVYRYTELMEMVNTEIRVSRATLNSLIYPDIYLFITGRQGVYQTLESIQNRLEIYVAE